MTATPTPLRERLRSEVAMAAMKDVFVLTRDELIELLGGMSAILSARDEAGAVGEPFLWIDPRQFDRVRRFANDPHVVGRRYAPAWLKKYDDDYIPLFLAALATRG